jgi:UDP-GlcNAc3NAcA epimerase
MAMAPRLKIISVVGARPQFIKLAPFARAVPRQLIHRIIHTGQHFDSIMSSVFFEQLKIPEADVNLGVHGGEHGAMTGRMMASLERVLIDERPDLVIVYGDTNSTLAGALTAAKLKIPVAHVEAGMRSFVMHMPEEINRRIADHVAQLNLCATPVAVRNLKNEGLSKGVHLTGDLMYEQLHDSRSAINGNREILAEFGLQVKEYCLLTAHRAGNVDDPARLTKLVELIESVDMPVLLPLHPRTKERLRQNKLERRCQKIRHLKIHPPLTYFDLLTVAKFARAVLTDSGGLQKEALFLGTPVLTLRAETEWTETLKWGNYLVDLDARRATQLLGQKLKVKQVDYRIQTEGSERPVRPSQVMLSCITDYLRGKK